MPHRKPGGVTKRERRVLAALADAPVYPYALAQTLNIPRRTITGALNRMEELGFTRSTSRQVLQSNGRHALPRRVYTITAKGRRALEAAEKV